MTPAELLAFEARGWLHAGAKERAIREELGLSPVGYYVALLAAASSAEGVAADAVTAARVRRLAVPRGRSGARWSA